jgi:NADH-quinone oxidoreductase subunit L
MTPVHDAHAAHEVIVHSSHLLRWIPLLPLVGAAVNFLLGTRIQRSFGRFGVAVIATLMPLLSFLLVLASFFRLRGLPTDERILVDTVARWIHIGQLNADIAFQFDPLTAVMTLVVTGIGSLIHIYSYGYMDEEPAAWRFFALLNLFMFAMLTLVLGDNLLIMFVGWEGVGLCSWALIGFWFSETANAQAGNKAFIVNRIGDFGFLLGLFLLFWTLDAHGQSTIVFRELAGAVGALEGEMLWGVSVATLVTLFFFVGAAGKSAQIPLYVWLPDAMAGPTPVSALIHAATMVTAGVYMIGRLNFLYSMAPFTLEVVAIVGGATALFAATIGLAQNDIKKVLAYSTVSQLGYMFMAMGVGAYAAGIFHLMTHAFFKACLFLGSGSVIHAMHHEQDMRKMGGLRKYMPRTFWTFLIATIAISGIPGTAGFFSKDEILWKAYLHHPALWAAGFAGAGMTAFYMFRLVFMTFFGESRADHHTQEHLHESSGWMTWPLIILAAGSILSGYVGIPPALGGSNPFEQFLAPVLGGHGGGHAAGAHGTHDLALEYFYMTMSVGMALVGIFLAYLMYNRRLINPAWFSRAGGGVLYKLIYNKYYVDEIYYGTFLRGTLSLSRALAWFDRTVVDGIVNGAASLTRLVSTINGLIDNYVVDGLVNFIANFTGWVGGLVRRFQTGSINAYLYGIVVVVTAVLFASTW